MGNNRYPNLGELNRKVEQLVARWVHISKVAGSSPALATKPDKEMKKLVEKDYEDAANLLRCTIAEIKAVAEVEGRNSGFNEKGLPKILFEGHWFWRYTKGKYGMTNYSYPKWVRTFYNMDQHKRLKLAVAKDRVAALKSTSWGMFQIMGFNYRKAGFSTLQSFINAMFKSEREHLLAFCNFVISAGLDDELRNQEWAEFAHGYNGPGFAENKYDIKLEAAYKKYSK